ncbi:hypothetical protein ACA910_012656 [Epithemia clementina (nom. ined.)]
MFEYVSCSSIISTSQESSVLSLVVGGPFPERYLAQVASFGNPLDGSDGNDVLRSYNLMFPPDDPALCTFPESFANMTYNQTLQIKEQVELMYPPTPVALLVNVDSCSAEQKAKVALEIKEKLMDQIELLVVYSADPQKTNMITLQQDNPETNNYSYRSIGLVFITYRTIVGIDRRMRISWAVTKPDPRLFVNNNYEWTFMIQLSNYTASGGNDDHFRGGEGQRDSSSSDTNGGDIYWFRIVLFSILVLSPCCRACYLWYAGGGRFYFRRNESGRIVGIQYVPPSPTWLSAGRGVVGNQGAASRRAGTLSEDQFKTLPEIEYKPIQSHYDEDSDEANGGSNNKCAEATDKTLDTDIESGISVSSDPKDAEDATKPTGSISDKEPELPQTAADANPDRSSIRNGVDGVTALVTSDETSGPFSGNNNEFAEDVSDDIVVEMERGEVKSLTSEVKGPNEGNESNFDMVKDDEALSKVEAFSFSSKPNDDGAASPEADDEDAKGEKAGEYIATKEESTNELLECKSSMCSVCIDEFEAGEKIILLPRCQHGFHRDCIHPWLTERQGCCPYCKTPVFSDPAEEAEDPEANPAPDASVEEPGVDTTGPVSSTNGLNGEQSDSTQIDVGRPNNDSELPASEQTNIENISPPSHEDGQRRDGETTQ